MKKGCFIKSVVIVTIFVGVIAYLIQNNFNNWFLEPGKKMLVQQIAENWKTEATFIKDSEQKDSVGILLQFYFKNIKTMEEVVNLENDLFLSELEDVIKDSVVTDNEVTKLTQILKKEENEKSTIN